MSLLNDLRVAYHLALSPIKGKTHRERLESFYKGQAGAYDDFRKRLLKGREPLFRRIPSEPGQVWVDMGGGTGANLEFIADRAPELGKFYVVDLSASLLKIADERIAANHWHNVRTVEADVIEFEPDEGAADIVTFSYSLTMIPDWHAAIDHALEILKPGGIIGVVDFYVARKYPVPGLHHHSWWQRTFWPTWFANDNVFLSPDHLPYLRKRFETVALGESAGFVPYLKFFGKVPFYRFIGRKRETGTFSLAGR